MSSSLVRRLTRFFGLKIINYDFPRWHTAEWENLDAIDALLNAAGLTNVVGVWQNSTAYTVGQRLIDADQGSIWICQVNHTSASSGTFEDDRTANPTYWTAFSSLPNYRGVWTTGLVYMPGDIVVVSSYAFYYCIQTHTAGATFAGDASKWALIFDATTAVNTATTAATNASNSATAAATSETNAATSATNAGNSATAAATSATNASNSATAAATSATNAATSETNAANSATEAANVVSDGVSGAIRTDTVQSFTGPQKAQAQTNLGFSGPVQTILDDGTLLDIRNTLEIVWEPIETKTVSGSPATLDFTTLSTVYRKFKISLVNIAPATDDAYLFGRIQTGGTTWQSGAAAYTYGGRQQGPNGGQDIGSTLDSLTTLIALTRPAAGQGIGNASGENIHMEIEITLGDANNFPLINAAGTYVRSDGIACKMTVGGEYGGTVVITGFRLAFSAGNFANRGTVKLYGMR